MITRPAAHMKIKLPGHSGYFENSRADNALILFRYGMAAGAARALIT